MLQTTVLLSVSYPTLHIIPIQYKAICIYWNSNMTGLVWKESTLTVSFLVFYHEPATNRKAVQAAGLTELEDRWTAQVPYLVAREEALYFGNNVRDHARAARERTVRPAPRGSLARFSRGSRHFTLKKESLVACSHASTTLGLDQYSGFFQGVVLCVLLML